MMARLSRAEQRRILRDDRRRRAARFADETEALVSAHVAATAPLPSVRGALINPELVRGAGVVTPPSDARVTRRGESSRAGTGTWAQVSIRDAHRPAECLAAMPAIGTGFTDDDEPVLTSRGGPTVRVTLADGSVSYVAASSYRRSRQQARSRQVIQAPQVVETARLQSDARDVEAMASGAA